MAPRTEFGRVLRSPELKPSDAARGTAEDAGVWAVVCFWVPRGQRGRGVGGALLDAAVEHARASGARAVEAYPVDAAARENPAGLFTGTVAMFTAAGFEVVHRPRRDRRRFVVRREL